MLRTIRHLLELIRFSHTVFALPFALLAAVMAWRLRAGERLFFNDAIIYDHRAFLTLGPFTLDLSWLQTWKFDIRLREVVGILFCMITARSFAMAVNRLADRKLDAENPRTAARHLPAGILGLGQVAAFAAACAVGFVASTLLFLPNRLPLYLSVPVLAFLAGYSFTKRFTALSHFWLGTALGLSPIAAWIAIRGDVVLDHPADLLPAAVLGGAVLAWVAGFDVIYACQDYDADRRAELHSVPVWLGIPRALRLAAACHVVTIALLAYLPYVYPLFGWIYWAGMAPVTALLVYEHWIVRPDDLSRASVAFFQINAVIGLALFAVGTLDLWLGVGS